MGFRSGMRAKVWESKQVSDKDTKIRISISSKNKRTDEWVQDFGDYCHCLGSAVATKAAKLKSGDIIKLGDVDVSNRYDKQKKVTYYDFKIFSFSIPDEEDGGSTASDPTPAGVDDGDVDDSNLPF